VEQAKDEGEKRVRDVQAAVETWKGKAEEGEKERERLRSNHVAETSALRSEIGDTKTRCLAAEKEVEALEQRIRALQSEHIAQLEALRQELRAQYEERERRSVAAAKAEVTAESEQRERSVIDGLRAEHERARLAAVEEERTRGQRER